MLNVLSVFDGISCGRVALERAGIKVDTYHASEIDKYAIQVAKKNYPDTIHIGDVYENVASMPSTIKDFISEEFDCEPILLNSELVSAQQRKRLYWTNIPGVEQPEDRSVLLKDIVEGEGIRVDREKSLAIIASIGRTTPREYFMKNQGQMVFADKDKFYCIDASYYKGANWQQYITKSRRQLVIEMINGDFLVRKLTPIECERCQTLPDDYTYGISNTQRYKCIGNGWTVDVIAHILSYIK